MCQIRGRHGHGGSPYFAGGDWQSSDNGLILGNDRNSGSHPVPVEFGPAPVRSGTGRFRRYQTGIAIFFQSVFLR